jgi:hypothetical protein
MLILVTLFLLSVSPSAGLTRRTRLSRFEWVEPLDQRVKPADGGGGLWGNGFKKTQPSTAQIMPKLRQILRQLAFKTHVFSGGWNYGTTPLNSPPTD